MLDRVGNGNKFIVMPKACYVDIKQQSPVIVQSRWDGDLSEFHIERARLSSCQLYAIAYSVAQGLKSLADRAIVHRDLTIRNVLWKKLGRANAEVSFAISDLGHACEEQRCRPRKGRFFHTAPETKASPAADVYSLGMLYLSLACRGENTT